jgi:Rap1a immunity proteins
MAGRATWMLAMLVALPLAIATAQAQNPEYDPLPKPAALVPPPAASVPAPAATTHPAPALPKEAKTAPEKQKAAEKAAKEKAPATAALGAKPEPKQKEEDQPLGRRMAPSAAIPPFPGDEKGPKTIEFLGACPGNFDRCMDQVREIGEKIPGAELCIPQDVYFATVTDRVRKWATLRPDVQGLPAGRVIAAALRSIYPCKHTPPARTAAEKGAPKAAKSAQ